MHVKYRQDNYVSYDIVYRYVWDNGHGLTTYVNFIVKCVCVIWALDPMVVLWLALP
jgi:hypothetical protein